MKIAIVGAGYAGLAACWHLQDTLPAAEITVFSDRPLGDSASGAAAGLLHNHVGVRCRLNWRGEEALTAAKQLLHAASQETGISCFQETPILRVPKSPEQHTDFRAASEQYAEVEWIERTAIQKLDPQIHAPEGGVLVHGGGTIDAQAYLKALWTTCEARGAQWRELQITSLDDLAGYNNVIIAAGIDTMKLPDCSHLTLRAVKGQALRLQLPSEATLSTPLSRGKYLVPMSDGTVIAGATFEKHAEHSDPDLKIATQEILPAIEAVYPPTTQATVADCRAGIRASAPGHLPILGQINEKTWVLTGLGSKGLLYHAWLAHCLATAFADSPQPIPPEVRLR